MNPNNNDQSVNQAPATPVTNSASEAPVAAQVPVTPQMPAAPQAPAAVPGQSTAAKVLEETAEAAAAVGAVAGVGNMLKGLFGK